jgi:hypothetical protein
VTRRPARLGAWPLIDEALPRQPRVSDVLGDRGYRALATGDPKLAIELSGIVAEEAEPA